MTSTWLMVSRSPRPCQPSRATWLSGSRREPNLEVVRRTPLATARTLPCCSVIRVTIRSASPRRMVRSTTPRSRKRVIWARVGSSAGAPDAVLPSAGSTGPFGPDDDRGAGPPPTGRPGDRPWLRPPPSRLLAAMSPNSTGGITTSGADRGEPGHGHEHDAGIDQHAEHDAGDDPHPAGVVATPVGVARDVSARPSGHPPVAALAPLEVARPPRTGGCGGSPATARRRRPARCRPAARGGSWRCGARPRCG